MTLEEGVAAVEAALGVPLAGGGKHPHMATHNRLLGLGDLYLEVIAVDPDAPQPAWPRWFDLDHFSGPPRLTNWIARCDDLAAALAACPAGHRRAGGPAARRLPLADGGAGRWPAAVRRWLSGADPVAGRAASGRARCPIRGVRLTRLEIAHPQARALRAALAGA